MAVNVSDNFSLDFVSTLDNSDFQNKSLEDIRLIKMRLELTGDISGITKYDTAVKNALAAEAKLRTDLAKLIEDAKNQTQQFTEQIQQGSGKATVFSDSKAEVEAYIASLGELNSITFDGTGSEALVASYKEDLQQLINKETEVNAAFEAGDITQQEYAAAIEKSREAQALLIEDITRVTASMSEEGAAVEKASVTIEEQVGILEGLKATLKELQAENLTLVSPEDLAKSNAQIQELEAEISRFKNMGKVGFDEFGNAVEQTVEKQSKFSLALSRATDLSNIGARAVSMLTRQIVGLGVGMLSFAVGAKAIEFIADWVSNLDIFTGRLDQAKQNMIAFNEVMADADKSAGSQLATLRLLYGAATDVNNSMEKRLEAAQQLREEFPTEFENTSNLAIANGKLKDSYNDVAASIINVAKSQAAQKKITELESTIQDEQYKIDQNNYKKARAIRDVKPLTEDEIQAQNRSGGGAVSVPEQIQSITNQTNFANRTSEENIKIANGQIDYLTQFVTNVTKNSSALDDANKLLGDHLEKFNSVLANANSETLLAKLKSSLQTKLDALAPNDPQISAVAAKLQKVDDLLKKYQVKATPTNQIESQAQALANAQANLQQKINQFATKNENTNLDPDQAALNKIKVSFDAIRFSITQANLKYDQFVSKYGKGAVESYNANPANVNKLYKIDPTTLDNAENTALTNQNTDNQTEHLKESLEEAKKLYADYEAYKIKAGSTAADAQYKDLLEGGKNFQEYLDNISKYVDTSDTTGPMQQRAKTIQTFRDQNAEEQKKAFDNLLQQSLTYQEQREAIIQKGQDDETQLRSKGFKDQADQVAKNTQDELTALDEANFKKLDSYKAVFDGITELTRQQTQENLNKLYGSAAAGLASGSITLEAYMSIIKQLNAAELVLKNSGLPQTLDEIGQAFGQIGQEISSVNSGLGQLVNQIGSTLQSLGKIQSLSNDLQNSSISDSQKTQDEISLWSTAASGTIKLINSITSASAERQAAAKAYYDSVIASQNEYNISLDDQLLLQEQLNQNVFYKDYKQDMLDASKALAQTNQQFEASLAQLESQGQAKVGTKSVVNGSAVASDALTGAATGAAIGSAVPVIGTAVGAVGGAVVGAIAGLFSSKPKDVLRPILEAYPGLLTKDKDGVDQFNEALAKNLIQNNLVSDSTKVLLQNTIALNDERQKAIDQINSDISDLAGSLGSDLENALVTAFENGTDAAVAFGQSVSKVIDNIVANFLFQDIFGQKLKDLQTSLEQSFSITGDQNATDDLTKFFQEAEPLTTEYDQALKQAQDAAAASGISLFQGPTTGSGGISGQIQQSLTEQTGTVIEGALNGIQLNTLQTNNILETQTLSLGQISEIAQSQLTVMNEIAQNTKRGADNTDGMIDTLKQIVSNTGSSAATELRAAGKYGY